jgi:hypothetical protein
MMTEMGRRTVIVIFKHPCFNRVVGGFLEQHSAQLSASKNTYFHEVKIIKLVWRRVGEEERKHRWGFLVFWLGIFV